MDVSLLSLLLFGLVLGIKHAIEPDHVIAVSNIATESKKLRNSLLAGVFWGIGHTLTLFIVGIIIIQMKVQISTTLEMSLEFVVGLLIIYLGASSYFSKIKKKSSVDHKSSNPLTKIFAKSLVVGTIHGLAGSAAIVVLTMSYVESIWESVIYILVFGFGTILGMMLFTTAFGLAVVWEKINVNEVVGKAVGILSIGFGLYYIYDIGISQGLFNLWFQ